MFQIIMYEYEKIWKQADLKKVLCFLLGMYLVFVAYQNHRLMSPDSVSYYKEENTAEKKEVKNYQNYLQGIQEQTDRNQNVSIFQEKKGSGFSEKNMRQTAKAYTELKGIRPVYEEGGKADIYTNNIFGDICIVILMIYICMLTVFEEKEKDLYLLTRSNPRGRIHSILAKMIMLGMSVAILVTLFYLSGGIVNGMQVGWLDIGKPIQSLYDYMDCAHTWSIGGFLMVSLLAKIMVLTFVAWLTMLLSFAAKQKFYVVLAEVVLWGGSVICYQTVLATSNINWIKYINLMGLLRGEEIFGNYLNLNFLGSPVTREFVSIVAAIFLLALFSGCNIWYFYKVKRLSIRTTKWMQMVARRKFFRFRPHTNLMAHEAYKIFIMNRGIVLVALLLLVLGIQLKDTKYFLSDGEKMYHRYMEYLQGELTQEKEEFLQREQKKYDDAQAKIDLIDMKIAKGKIDEWTGEGIKLEYRGIMGYYPVFQKVQKLHSYIKKNSEEKFVYDTGYYRLFGMLDYSVFWMFGGIILWEVLLFGEVFTMERKNKRYQVIFATVKGRCQIQKKKYAVCITTTLLGVAAICAVRVFVVCRQYGLNSMTSRMSSLEKFHGKLAWLPMGGAVFITILIVICFALVLLHIILYLTQKYLKKD